MDNLILHVISHLVRYLRAGYLTTVMVIRTCPRGALPVCRIFE